MPARFSEDELRRYSRQMLLREVGGRGQERLRAAPVELRCGRGAAQALAVVAARYLLRAGVLQLRLVNFRDHAAALAADAPPGWCGALGEDDDPEAATWLQLPPPLPRLWARAEEDGPIPFAAGAALALEALQLLLGLPGGGEMP